MIKIKLTDVETDHLAEALRQYVEHPWASEGERIERQKFRKLIVGRCIEAQIKKYR